MAKYKPFIKNEDGTLKEIDIKIPEDLDKIETIPFNEFSIIDSLEHAINNGKTFITYKFKVSNIDGSEIPPEVFNFIVNDNDYVVVTAISDYKAITGEIYDVTLSFLRYDNAEYKDGFVHFSPIKWWNIFIKDSSSYVNPSWLKIYPSEDTFTKPTFYYSLIQTLNKAYEDEKKFISYTFSTADVSDFPTFIDVSDNEDSLVNVTAILNGLAVTGKFYDVTITQWISIEDDLIHFIPNKWTNLYNPTYGFINDEWINSNIYNNATKTYVDTAIAEAISDAINEDY